MGDGVGFLGGGGAGRWGKKGEREVIEKEAGTDRILQVGIGGKSLLTGEIGRRLDGAHLVPNVTVTFLIELDDIHDGLGVLFLF